jgi:hypothetical protein
MKFVALGAFPVFVRKCCESADAVIDAVNAPSTRSTRTLLIKWVVSNFEMVSKHWV